MSGEQDSYLECSECGRKSTTNFSHSLRNGWEKCCGYTMTLKRTDADIGGAVGEAFRGSCRRPESRFPMTPKPLSQHPDQQGEERSQTCDTCGSDDPEREGYSPSPYRHGETPDLPPCPDSFHDQTPHPA